MINHRQALAAQVDRLAVPPVTHISALSNTAEHVKDLAELIAPQGRIAVITDHDTFDVAPFKAKSVSLHWEMAFTRPLYRTGDMITRQHILNQVSGLAEAGVLHSTLCHRLQPLNAASLKKAHRLIEKGGIMGKVVVTHSEDDVIRLADEYPIHKA